MTSQPSLPLVEAGMIWDGSTEYENARPTEVVASGNTVWLLRMVGDGSRRWTKFNATSRPMDDLIRHSTQEDTWETIGITFEHAQQFLYYDGPVTYLDYDGSLSAEPVNQVPYTTAFKDHAARFAHQLDAGMGVHTLLSAEERDRLIILNTQKDVIGSAVIRYDEWGTVDPEELIIGGVYDGTLLWKRNLPDMQEIDRILCGQCGNDQFAQLIYEYADLPAMRRNYRDNGSVYALDRTTTPWSPTLFDLAPGSPPFADFYESLEAAYKAARLRYYHSVGAV